MVTVLKFDLGINGNVGQTQATIKMPRDCQIVNVGLGPTKHGLGEAVSLYALCEYNSDEIYVLRDFEVYGTGNIFNDKNLKYIGSVYIHNGMRHVFEKI